MDDRPISVDTRDVEADLVSSTNATISPNAASCKLERIV
jgi:hypothetical protein